MRTNPENLSRFPGNQSCENPEGDLRMSIADNIRDQITGGSTGQGVTKLSASQLAFCWDEAYPDEIEADGISIAFTYEDGSILIFDSTGLRVNNDDVEAEEDSD